MLDTTPSRPGPQNWKPEQRAWCVQRYFETRSYAKIKAEFGHRFGTEKSPTKSAIYKMVKKFKAHWSCENLNKKSDIRESHSGRPRIRSLEVIELVRESVEKSPKRSSRKRTQILPISRSTMLRVMKEDLGMYSYRIQTVQKLTTADKSRRMELVQVLADKIEISKSFLSNLWTSDEAHFHLDGQVNSKNNIFWGTSPPSEVRERPLHSSKVTVWVAMSVRGIIGPIFFEDENGSTVTINSERYVAVLNKFWVDLEQFCGTKINRQWFQQDGATPHTANISIEWLKQHFNSRVVSKRCEIQWPPYSPDLSPPDFYLWGYLKDRVYQEKPKDLHQLKQKIREEIESIQTKVLKGVMQNFALRLKKCLDAKGGHLENML